MDIVIRLNNLHFPLMFYYLDVGLVMIPTVEIFPNGPSIDRDYPWVVFGMPKVLE
jgi:hypothetical protein